MAHQLLKLALSTINTRPTIFNDFGRSLFDISWRKAASCTLGKSKGAIVLVGMIAAGLFSAAGDSKAVTIKAASASFADVSAAVAAAGRGDTVTVPAGSATWSSTLTLTKGISLLGAGRDSLTITRSGSAAIAINPDATAIANDETIRVDGFTFDGSNSANHHITVVGAGETGTKPFKNLVISNNRFKNSTLTLSDTGVISTTGQVRGVIANNIFDRCNEILKVIGNDDPVEWQNGHYPFAFGSSDNLFFESNTITYSSSFSGSDPGWIETGQGARVVVRYNTFNFANTTCSEYWDVHGFQNWPGGQTGTMIVEYYGNTLTNTSGYRWVNHRGSWGLFFNNVMTGTNGGSIEINEYGCSSEVPGGTGSNLAEVNNTYVFNNTVNGTIKNMSLNTAKCGIAENKSWWNYDSSFDGSTGIGRGTSVPGGTCTVGVAYWKASTVTPTVDPNVIQNGHLYKCLSTNVWTDYYTPYTYPHPLVTGDPPPTPTPTATPSPTPTPTATPKPTPTPSPTATPTGDISFPANSGSITSPFVINGDATVSQSVLTVDPAQGGRAVYTFNVTSPGDYVVSSVMNCPDEGSNSFFINIDAEPTTAMIWNIPVTAGFEERTATWSPDTASKVWTLNAGVHQLIIRGREANAVLGRITVSVPPTPPDGLQILP